MVQQAQQRRTVVPEQAAPAMRANVYEPPGGEMYVIEIPLAGLSPDEIVIEADVTTVTVSTEPRDGPSEQGRQYLQQEHSPESMSRVFEFPTELDTDNIRATLENGVLKIRAPKAAAARRRIIRVAQAGGGQDRSRGEERGQSRSRDDDR